MNDLEWLFHVKMRFQPALLESERLNVKKITQPLRFCGVLSIAYQLASLGRHAQLTRCFSAVAELLVYKLISNTEHISMVEIIASEIDLVSHDRTM